MIVRQSDGPPTISALREEREREGIGELIEREIRTQLRALARRRSPRLLLRADVDRWSAELEDDLAADFVVHLLRGRLSEIFDHAQTLEHFRLLLRARARQFLANKMRGGESENLWRRARELLEARDGRFEAHSTGVTRRWSVTGGPARTFEGDDLALRRLAWSLPVPPSMARYRRDTQIASAVVSDDDLCDLVEAALRAAGAALSTRDLRIVLDERLDLHASETISIWRRTGDAPPLSELLTDRSDPAATAEVELVASDAVALLTIRQIEVLGLRYAEERSRADTATSLGVSHGTVDNEVARAVRVVLDAADGDRAVARDVLAHVIERWSLSTRPGWRA